MLAVLGRVADIVQRGPFDAGKTALEQTDQLGGIVEAQCRLRDVSHRRTWFDGQRRDVRRRGHDVYGRIHRAGRAFDFLMPAVTDHDDRVALTRIAAHLRVHLGDQRTSRVDDTKAAAPRARDHFARHAVRAEYGHGAARNVLDLVDEDGAARPHALDDVPVVHDLVKHVNRAPVNRERPIDDGDRTLHACTEAARLCEQHIHHDVCGISSPVGASSPDAASPGDDSSLDTPS